MKTLKAGKYYIGDCCYVLSDPDYDWQEFCHQFFDDEENIKMGRAEIVAYSTAWGDGVYPSNIGAEFPVDAGLIGIMPKRLWKGEGEPVGCTLVHFKESFECYKEDGKLHFGHVTIDTDPEYAEENE
jgi:hypothetical protein